MIRADGGAGHYVGISWNERRALLRQPGTMEGLSRGPAGPWARARTDYPRQATGWTRILLTKKPRAIRDRGQRRRQLYTPSPQEAPMNRRIHILAGLTALGLAGFALFLWTGRTDAGADKVAFPANYKDGVLYQVADRYDIKQYRELYASPAAIAAAKADKP